MLETKYIFFSMVSGTILNFKNVLFSKEEQYIVPLTTNGINSVNKWKDSLEKAWIEIFW